jgi:hypothetical protein
VAAVTNAEFECVHLSFDIFNAKEAASGVARIVHNRDSGGDSTSTEEHVSNTGVLEFLYKSMNTCAQGRLLQLTGNPDFLWK